MNNSELKKFLTDDNVIGFCLKDTDGKVISQNNSCKQVCNNREGQTCEDNCMALFQDHGKELKQTHTQCYKGQVFNDTPCDVVLINNGESLITLLVLLNNKINDFVSSLQPYKLSYREVEVVTLLFIGKTNQEISSQLNVAISTIRTHINHIRDKVPFEYLRGIRDYHLQGDKAA